MRSYHGLGQASDAERLVAELLADPDASTLATVADFRQHEGKLDVAAELFESALQSATSSERDLVFLQLAKLQLQRKEFAAARDLFKEIADFASSNDATRGYVLALYETKEYREALEVCQRVRANGSMDPGVATIEAAILETFDLLAEAISLRQALCDVEPTTLDHVLRLAIMEYRQGHQADARATLRRIPAATLTDPVTIIQVAELRSILGEPDVLPLAFKARRLGYGLQAIHRSYRSLFMNHEHAEAHLLAPPDEVAVGASVRVSLDGRDKVFTIVDGGPVTNDLGEIGAGDPYAGRLLQAKKGDVLSLPRPFGGEQSCEVLELLSPYVFAFQQSMGNYAELFPQQTDIQMFSFSPDDPSQVLAILDRGRERAEELLSIYDRKLLTIGALAELLGKKFPAVWAALRHRMDARVFVSPGTPDRLASAQAQVASHAPIVIDLPALLTITWLDLEETLAQLPFNLFAAQATIDELRDVLLFEHTGKRRAGNLYSREGSLALQEESSDDLDREAQFVARAIAFVEAHCTITASRLPIELSDSKRQELMRVFGEPSFASAALSAELNAMLLSDDLVTQMLALQQFQVPSAATHELLAALVANELLDEDELFECACRLIESRYRHVPVNAKLLVWATASGSGADLRRAEECFASLSDPDCTEESALIVAADVISWASLAPVSGSLWRVLVSLAASAAIKGRRTEAVAAKLARRVGARLAGRPLAARRAMDAIVSIARTGALP